jgi:predicted transcriptional regulator
MTDTKTLAELAKRLLEIEDEELKLREEKHSVNAEVGAKMRKMREDAGISLRSMATALFISAPFLSDMEKGRRNYTHGWIKKVNRVIKKS